MFRAKSLLDEILGEATGKQFSPVIQPAPAQPAPAQPAPARSWFQAPQEVQNWNYYNSETGPPEMYGADNLATIIGNKAHELGYQGDTYGFESGGGDQPATRVVSPAFQNWLAANGYQLSGESANVNGSGGVNAFLLDQTGNRVAQQDYATDDSGFFNFGIGLLGMGSGLGGSIGGAMGLNGPLAGAVGNGVVSAGNTMMQGGNLGDALKSGALSGVANYGLSSLVNAGGNMFANEGANQLAGADLSVSPESLSAITPQIGELSDVAALIGNQVSALNPNMFAGEGLAQLASDPWLSTPVSQAELAAITPDVSSIGATQSNMFANEGAKQLADKPPTLTPEDLAKVTPAIGGGGLLGSLTGAAGGAADWLKANPIMGRLLMSGAGALVSGLGGSGGGSAASGSTNYGPAKQWTSPIQSGLLSAPRNVQQVQPGGLLGGPGVANSGAWQWRK